MPAAVPLRKLNLLELTMERAGVVSRYQFLVKNFEQARQSEAVKTMGQKHKARVDDAKSQLDEAYKKLIARYDELIEVTKEMEGFSGPA